MELHRFELLAHRGVRPGQEACANAVGDLAEPEIEAGRLDLVRFDLRRAENLAALDQRADALAGKDAGAHKRAARSFDRRRHLGVLGQMLEEPVLRFRAMEPHG